MEYLAAQRVAAFVEYVQKNDMQVTANRRTGATMIQDCLVRPREDALVVTLGNDKFDKLVTYLSQNDLQVHGADASSTVGIYAFVKVVAELRRSLRAFDEDGLPSLGDPDNARRAGLTSPSGPALNRLGFSPLRKVDPSRVAPGRPAASRSLFSGDPSAADAPEEKVEGLKDVRGGSREVPSRPIT